MQKKLIKKVKYIIVKYAIEWICSLLKKIKEIIIEVEKSNKNNFFLFSVKNFMFFDIFKLKPL